MSVEVDWVGDGLFIIKSLQISHYQGDISIFETVLNDFDEKKGIFSRRGCVLHITPKIGIGWPLFRIASYFSNKLIVLIRSTFRCQLWKANLIQKTFPYKQLKIFFSINLIFFFFFQVSYSSTKVDFLVNEKKIPDS